MWCVPALRVPLVHSQINHFRQGKYLAFFSVKAVKNYYCTRMQLKISLPPCGVCLLCGCRWFSHNKTTFAKIIMGTVLVENKKSTLFAQIGSNIHRSYLTRQIADMNLKP